MNTSNRKRFRVKNKIKKVAKSDRFRLCVSRSTKNISAQIIDDKNSKTLFSASSIEKAIKNLIWGRLGLDFLWFWHRLWEVLRLNF